MRAAPRILSPLPKSELTLNILLSILEISNHSFIYLKGVFSTFITRLSIVYIGFFSRWQNLRSYFLNDIVDVEFVKGFEGYPIENQLHSPQIFLVFILVKFTILSFYRSLYHVLGWLLRRVLTSSFSANLDFLFIHLYL